MTWCRLSLSAEEIRCDVCCAVATENTADYINAGVSTCLVVVPDADVASAILLRGDLSHWCVVCALTGIAP